MEAAEEGVTLVAVSPVEPLRVAAVEPLHPDRKCRLRRRDEQVVVVPHQAIGSNEPLVPDTGLCKQRKEVPVLASVGVELLPAHPAIHQVVDGTGELNAWRARHHVNLRARNNAPKPTVTLGAKQSLVRHSFGSDPTV